MAVTLCNRVPQSVERFGLPYEMMSVLDLERADKDHVAAVVVGSTTSWSPSCWGRLEVVVALALRRIVPPAHWVADGDYSVVVVRIASRRCWRNVV